MAALFAAFVAAAFAAMASTGRLGGATRIITNKDHVEQFMLSLRLLSQFSSNDLLNS